MKIRINVSLNFVLTIAMCVMMQSVKAQVHIIKPVKIADVQIQDSFWSPKLKVWDTKTVYDVFDKLFVNSVTGQAIPLKQIATIEFETSPNLVRHFDKARFSTVTAFVKNGYLYEDVTKEVLKKLDKYSFPKGYHYVAAGEVENKQESFGGLGAIIMITAFGFIAVLVLEFGNFKSTIAYLDSRVNSLVHGKNIRMAVDIVKLLATLYVWRGPRLPTFF